MFFVTNTNLKIENEYKIDLVFIHLCSSYIKDVLSIFKRTKLFNTYTTQFIIKTN